MASTYVNDLRLNEMATGDASGSWGTVTNTNLELIGEAFSYGTETIGDADSTLTIADGAADAARSFYLKITSSVDLTTTRIVTLGPNTVSKVWMIENATTGSQVITIKQGSGATINVPNGQVKMISTDGAGSGGAVLDLLVDVDLTGTTTLVNLDVSGTLGVTGVLTATSLDISGDIDVDGTTNLDVVDIDGAVDMASTLLVTGVLTTTAATVSNGGGQFNGAINVGVDDTGYDVKFFGATAGAYMLWDESADDLILGGAAGLSVNSTALVTGVLTTTAQAVFNGGFDGNAKATINTADGLSSDYALIITNGETTAGQNFGLRVRGGSNASDVAFTVETYDNANDLFRLYGNGQASFHDGSVSAPSITNIGDLNTGMYFPADETIGFTSGGVASFKLDNQGHLIYEGSFQLQSDAQTGGLTIAGGNNSNDGANIAVHGPSHASLANITRFRQDTVESLRIDASGNIIIASTGGTLQTATAGTSNFRAGVNAGAAIVSGANYNTLIGDEAGDSLVSGGVNNTAVGYQALASEDANGNATAIGFRALGNQNAGAESYNVAVGIDAGLNLSTAVSTTLVGGFAGGGATLTGQQNTAIGRNAGYVLTSGAFNTFVGSLAGDSTDDGAGNVAVGQGSLSANCGDNNTAIGLTSLALATGGGNTAIGHGSGDLITTGQNNSILGGYNGNQGGLDIRTSEQQHRAVGWGW
jgi:hypothetical protein